MYNFTVDIAHTYFVGEGQWLVHNACPVIGDENGLARVSRWMDPDEYAAMIDTKTLQEGSGGVTSVSYPASPSSYGSQATSGSGYVEFDVPANTMYPGGRNDWFVIPVPNSTFAQRLVSAGKLPKAPQMPRVSNIELIMVK